MEEPGRLQSMRSQRVGHNWAASLVLDLPHSAWNHYFTTWDMRDWVFSILRGACPRQSLHPITGGWAEEGSIHPLATLPQNLASATSSWDRMKNADIQLSLRRWHLKWEAGGEGVLCSWQHKSRVQFLPHWAGSELSESWNFLFLLLINLFLAVLGLRCGTWAFSGRGECGLLFTAVLGLLIAVAPPVAEPGL